MQMQLLKSVLKPQSKGPLQGSKNGKPLGGTGQKPLQRQVQGSQAGVTRWQTVVNRSRATSGASGAKDRLPEAVQAKMEAGFGTSFSDVRVQPASQEAKALGARAFTRGNQIHFAPGQYRPQSMAGQRLIGHELAHVVQQREGRVTPNRWLGKTAINADPRLEGEADRRASHVVQGKFESARDLNAKGIRSPDQGHTGGSFIIQRSPDPEAQDPTAQNGNNENGNANNNENAENENKEGAPQKKSLISKIWGGLKEFGNFLIGNSLGHPYLIERLGARGKKFIEVANYVYSGLQKIKLVSESTGANNIIGLISGSLGVINAVHTMATTTRSYLEASLLRYAKAKAVKSPGALVSKAKGMFEIVSRFKLVKGISQMLNSLASLAMAICMIVGAVTMGVSALVGFIVKAVTYIITKITLEVGARQSVQKQLRKEPITLDDQETEAMDEFTNDQIGLPYTELASKKGFFARKYDTLKKTATSGWNSVKSGANTVKGWFSSSKPKAVPAT